MRVFLLLLVLSGGQMPSFARASETVYCPERTKNEEENKKVARQLFRTGAAFYKTGHYMESAASYECVLKFVPYSVRGRYMLARSHDAAGQYSLARKHYRMVAVMDNEEAASLAPEIRKRLQEIARLPDRDKSGRETPDNLVPPISPTKRKLVDQWWFWGGIGVTGALTGTTVFLGLKALDLQNQLKENWTEDTKTESDRTKLLTDVSLGFTVVSAAALLTGIHLFRSSGSSTTKPPPEVRSMLLPSCTGQGCMMHFTLVF